MKKFMSMMLGLSLVLGAATVFAQEKKDEPKKEKKAKAKKAKGEKKEEKK